MASRITGHEEIGLLLLEKGCNFTVVPKTIFKVLIFVHFKDMWPVLVGNRGIWPKTVIASRIIGREDIGLLLLEKGCDFTVVPKTIFKV
jgi:hypothetical protein